MRHRCNLGNPWIGNFDTKPHVFLAARVLKRGFRAAVTLCGPLMRLFSYMGKMWGIGSGDETDFGLDMRPDCERSLTPP
jgi:hypothetical protein